MTFLSKLCFQLSYILWWILVVQNFVGPITKHLETLQKNM